MKYTAEMAPDGMIRTRCFMKIGSGIQAILILLLQESEETAVLVLLM
jgi:hypothetical protein